MRETPILVLDETDRLLDMGFRREIDKIMKYLPKKEHRQTLLFSATVPKELKQIMSENMRKDFVEADCIHEEDSGQHTNAQVEQSHVVLPSMDRYVSSVVEIVQQAMNEDPEDHKIVVFFPTARMVGFFADFFNVGLGREVIEIHSKKSQSYRTKASDKFRKAKRGVLFTSDVSARGELVLEYCLHTSGASLAAKF
jgi:ATP-dependent RNA helicase MSS116